jgi:hypothetical protein
MLDILVKLNDLKKENLANSQNIHKEIEIINDSINRLILCLKEDLEEDKQNNSNNWDNLKKIFKGYQRAIENE